MSDALVILKKICLPWRITEFRWPMEDMARFGIFLGIVVLAHVARGLGYTDRLTRVRSPWLLGLFWGLVVVLIALLAAPIRARFIYFQF